MNRPNFNHNVVPVRSYGRLTKVEVTKKKLVTIAKTHQKSSAVMKSYSDILSCDNSLIMDFDIEGLEEETSKYSFDLKVSTDL
jgi:hypothetical protein